MSRKIPFKISCKTPSEKPCLSSSGWASVSASMAVVFLFLMAGCGQSTSSSSSGSVQGSPVTVAAGGFSGTGVPDQVQSVQMDVYNTAMMELVDRSIQNVAAGDAPLFAFNLPFGINATFIATAYSNVDGFGLVLYSGETAGIPIPEMLLTGESVQIEVVLDLVDTLPPDAITQSATEMTNTIATLNGTVNPIGLATAAYFEWGFTASYGNKTSIRQMGVGVTPQTIAETLTNLTPGAVYYYRLVALRGDHTVYGENFAFITTASVPVGSGVGFQIFDPSVVTYPATPVTQIGKTIATLNATVIPNGPDTQAYFEWGQSTNYGTTTDPQAMGSGYVGQNLIDVLLGLMPETTYHFRAIAFHSTNVAIGDDLAFQTLNRSWANREIVGTYPSSLATQPQIAVNENGDAIAAWESENTVGGIGSIYASRHTPCSAEFCWESPQLLVEGGDPRRPQVAIDQDGNIVVVWEQDDETVPSDRNIFSARYDAILGDWRGASSIENLPGDGVKPQIAMDAQGAALVVWQQFDGADSIYSNRFDPVFGWGMAQAVETRTGSAEDPQIAIDKTGNALAVWRQKNGTYYDIFAGRLSGSVGSVWGPSFVLETQNGDVFNPQVVVNKNGNGVAVWSQEDTTLPTPSRFDIHANRFSSATLSWESSSTILDTSSAMAEHPQVAMDETGNITTVWEQFDGTTSIYAARFTVTAGTWGGHVNVDSLSGGAGAPQVQVDQEGNALVMWHQIDSDVNSIYFNRFTVRSDTVSVGWGNATWSGTPNPNWQVEGETGDALHPQLGIDAQGNALSVWEQFDGGISKIYSNKFE